MVVAARNCFNLSDGEEGTDLGVGEEALRINFL